MTGIINHYSDYLFHPPPTGCLHCLFHPTPLRLPTLSVPPHPPQAAYTVCSTPPPSGCLHCLFHPTPHRLPTLSVPPHPPQAAYTVCSTPPPTGCLHCLFHPTPHRLPTLSVPPHPPQAAYTSKNLTVMNHRVQLNIWDTAGQERYHALGPIYYRERLAYTVC